MQDVHTRLIDVLKMFLAERMIEQWERAKLPVCPRCKKESGQFVRIHGSKHGRVCVRCARIEEDRVEKREVVLGKLAENPSLKMFGFKKEKRHGR